MSPAKNTRFARVRTWPGRILHMLILLSTACLSAGTDRPGQPNIVLILTDDLGWQDVKCYDVDEPSPMETPRLDALAKQGVMFWQAYAPAPVCAPSRCAIMSGIHPARAQKTNVVGGAPPAPGNPRTSRMMDPWYSGRMPADTLTIAKVLRNHGYATGHSGKWHMAIDHHAFPQPEDQGFEFTRSSRGSRAGMKDRLKDFASHAPEDPYRLDDQDLPFDQTNEDALAFLRENKSRPFFLYYATWLVHSPIHTRSKNRLEKYAKRLKVDPAHPANQDTPGQINPFYAAMVEELDMYLGRIFDYLDQTEDPRWPGHPLRDNTYLIVTSDNGGMEGNPTERYTDNEPLARGKISAMEGGTRVPLFIRGPGIPAGVQSDVMVNGLDFYPTFLAMAGLEKPSGLLLDGCNLLPLLHQDPQDAGWVKHEDGSIRDTMVWHYPHGAALESTIRIGDYKLVRNYEHENHPTNVPLELYRLYQTRDGKTQRADIEESKNLVEAMPEKAASMNARLTEILEGMQASYPYYNPGWQGPMPHKEQVCTPLEHQVKDGVLQVRFRENGARVVRADLIYTLNGGQEYEEWYRAPAGLLPDQTARATLPVGCTHAFINLIDEHQFLVSIPPVRGKRGIYAGSAIALPAGRGTSQSISQ